MSAEIEDTPMAVVESEPEPVPVNDMTSADYYFDSYAHFGNNTVKISMVVFFRSTHSVCTTLRKKSCKIFGST